MTRGGCVIAGCESDVYAKGMCKLHWRRQREHGDPHYQNPRASKGMPPIARIMRHVLWDGECLVYAPPGKPLNGGHYGISNGTENVLVHRYMWEQYNERAVPEGLVVRHRCDNPPCIHPDHIILGTPGDNSQDRKDRGRVVVPLGEQHRLAKLTDATVLEIRHALAYGESNHTVAARYGVSRTTISNIRSGKSWKHIPRTSVKEKP